MRLTSPPQVASETKHEDKVEALKSYLCPIIRNADADAISSTLTLLAVSADSPIARAVTELGSEIAAKGLRVRAIFHSLQPESGPRGWTASGPAIPFDREVRWARNPRLADAHEQFVCGTETAWVGDCLRRDGYRRDAYEQRVNADRATVATLERSFERVWAICEPLAVKIKADARSGAIAPVAPVEHTEAIDGTVALADETQSSPATRQ